MKKLRNTAGRTDEEKSRELLMGMAQEVQLDMSCQPTLTPEQDIAARWVLYLFYISSR